MNKLQNYSESERTVIIKVPLRTGPSSGQGEVGAKYMEESDYKKMCIPVSTNFGVGKNYAFKSKDHENGALNTNCYHY